MEIFHVHNLLMAFLLLHMKQNAKPFYARGRLSGNDLTISTQDLRHSVSVKNRAQNSNRKLQLIPIMIFCAVNAMETFHVA